MTNEELIAKIKAEIERLIGESDFDESANLYSLLSFLSTLEEPKKDYNQLYKDIAKSEWFKKSYVGKSLGDVVPIEEPACDELEEELDRFIASGKSVTVDDYGTYKVSYHDFKKIARHFAEWQKAQDDKMVDIIYQQGIEKGKDEMKDEFEKNRLAACDNQTKEEYDREVEFATEIINKEHRQPTFSDAINYGMKLQKQQMMKETVAGEVCGRVYDHINVRFADGVCKYLEPKNISHIPADVSKYKVGDKVRIIVCKNED